MAHDGCRELMPFNKKKKKKAKQTTLSPLKLWKSAVRVLNVVKSPALSHEYV